MPVSIFIAPCIEPNGCVAYMAVVTLEGCAMAERHIKASLVWCRGN